MIQEAYMYDYLIQIDLTTVNGLTFKDQPKDGQPKKTVANIFFKV